MTRAQASRLTFDELVAAGVCECGRDLDTHPPLATPKPPRSWMAERHDNRSDLEPEMGRADPDWRSELVLRSGAMRRGGAAA